MKNANGEGGCTWPALTRVTMGLIFLWAFFDKVFGLGFTTAADKSWLDGVSPTLGFLKFGTTGPLSGMYQAMAGNILVDWLFMLALLLIGLALILGIGLKIAGYSGALFMLMMWSAVLPPEHHPFLDEHIVYMFLLLWFASLDATKQFGLGKWWSGTVAKKAKWLA